MKLGTHNETLSVVAMRVYDPDCSPSHLRLRKQPPPPTGFAKIISDDFPVLHPSSSQPQRQPAFLRLRGIISQYRFTRLDFAAFVLHTAITK
jgi:hypothetical protein